MAGHSLHSRQCPRDRGGHFHRGPSPGVRGAATLPHGTGPHGGGGTTKAAGAPGKSGPAETESGVPGGRRDPGQRETPLNRGKRKPRPGRNRGTFMQSLVAEETGRPSVWKSETSGTGGETSRKSMPRPVCVGRGAQCVFPSADPAEFDLSSFFKCYPQRATGLIIKILACARTECALVCVYVAVVCASVCVSPDPRPCSLHSSLLTCVSPGSGH